MARDTEDLLEGRLDEDERALAEAVAHAGFELRRPRKRPWEELALDALPAPQDVVARITGNVGGALVDVYEYEVAATEGKPRTVVAAIVRHPGITGQANISKNTDDPWYAWVLVALLLLGFLPITLPIGLWLFLTYKFGKQPAQPKWESRAIGSKDFAHKYKVKAPSVEGATAAVPPALQTLLATGSGITMQVRPGLLACTLPLERLDRTSAPRAIELAERLLAAAVPNAATTAETPYRVSMPVAAPTEAVALPEDEAEEAAELDTRRR